MGIPPHLQCTEATHQGRLSLGSLVERLQVVKQGIQLIPHLGDRDNR